MTKHCTEEECDRPASWTWWTGKGGAGRYCDDHAIDQLPEERELPSYKDPFTTAENVTLLRGETAIVPGGGVMPLDGSYPVLRSREAFVAHQHGVISS